MSQLGTAELATPLGSDPEWWEIGISNEWHPLSNYMLLVDK